MRPIALDDVGGAHFASVDVTLLSGWSNPSHQNVNTFNRNSYRRRIGALRLTRRAALKGAMPSLTLAVSYQLP